MKYKIEVTSIDSEVIKSAKAATLKTAIKKAIALSLKYNKTGTPERSSGAGYESVWVERFDEGELSHQLRFTNGKLEYETRQ
jgi:hypothetical protein